MTRIGGNLLAWTALLLQTASLSAQAGAAYSVKFACGLRSQATTASTVFEAVAPGRYFTAINIRNASADTARIRVQIATTRAAPAPGQLLPLPGLVLPPQLALELDCREILRASQASVTQSSPFLKGFVTLTPDREIDVVAVYSAGPGPAVQTMDVERVLAHRREAGGSCPDLAITALSNPLLTANLQTRLQVTVRNVGSADASNVDVQVEDQSRTTPDRQATATIPVLAAGAQTDVALTLAYQVAGSNWSSLVVTVDPKQQIAECDETNNQRPVNAP